MGRKRKVISILVFYVLLVTIFICLYHNFIFSDEIYAYSDIGSDTYAQYIPNILYDINRIKNNSNDIYSLDYGLGRYETLNFFKYFNPVNIPLFYADSNLQLSLIFSTFLKYLVIGTFSLLFFRKILKTDVVVIVASLLWTFNGYNILWGQHYQNLTNMVMFTIALYGLQLYLDNDAKKLLFIPCFATLAFTSYLCFYISCVFFFVYSVSYLLIKKTSLRDILKKGILCFLGIILAVGMAAEFVIPSVETLIDSTRISSISSINVTGLYRADFYFSFLARLLSNNALGVGNAYNGPINYYELANLSLSLLVILSFSSLLTRKYWKRILVFSILFFVPLFLPLFSHILSFRASTQRWTFILCMAETLLVGYGLEIIYENLHNKKYLVKTILVFILITSLVFGILKVGELASELDFKIDNFYDVFIVIGIIIVFFIWLIITSNKEFAWCFIVLIVAFEAIFMNYPTVNRRKTITISEWNNGYYNDGTKQIVQWINGYDKSLYRINKTYMSASKNDQLMQGYHGASVYSSTNSSELVRLYRSLGYITNDTDTITASNYISFSGSNIIDNYIVGAKYVIGKDNAVLDNVFYKKIYDNEFGFSVYQNNVSTNIIRFYDESISDSVFSGLLSAEKCCALTKYFVYKGGDNNIDISNMCNQIDLKDFLINYNNIELVDYGDILAIKGLSDDMQMEFEIPTLNEEEILFDLVIEMDCEEDTDLQVFFWDEVYGYREEVSKIDRVVNGNAMYKIDLSNFAKPTKVRLDPSAKKQDIDIKTIYLETIDSNEVLKQIENNDSYYKSSFSEEDGKFTALVESSKSGYVLIPLLYDNNWEVKLNGEEVAYYESEGLIGIRIEKGNSSIVLRNVKSSHILGRIIGIVSFIIYLIIVVLNIFKKKVINEGKRNE